MTLLSCMPSQVVATDGCVLVTRDVDRFLMSPSADENIDAYKVSGVFKSDAILSSSIQQELTSVLGSETIKSGMNASADSFYASQGRVDPEVREDEGDRRGVRRLLGCDHEPNLVPNGLKRPPPPLT